MKKLEASKVSEDARLPTRNHLGDAGLDLYANLRVDAIRLKPHEARIIPTGIAVKIESGYVGLLWPKGKSIHLVGAGVVDSGYQGEILVKVVNYTDDVLPIENGQAIAQLLIQPIVTPVVVEVPYEDLTSTKTSRNTTGGIVTAYLNTTLEFVEDESL